MSTDFGKRLRRLRQGKGISQQQLAERLFVDRSSVARWEIGLRTPDATLIPRIAECLGTDVSALLRNGADTDNRPRVILVDDEEIILSGGLPTLETVMPGADISCFTRPSDAIAFAREAPVALAFLDVEMGKVSGLDLCGELLQINPLCNVIYLTAYAEYSFEAWATGASGFMLKPITEEEVRRQLTLLRHPVRGLDG